MSQKITLNTFVYFDFRRKFTASLRFILWRNLGCSGREFGPFFGRFRPFRAVFSPILIIWDLIFVFSKNPLTNLCILEAFKNTVNMWDQTEQN